jgi:LPXTG-motif cell wall-anchored protein
MNYVAGSTVLYNSANTEGKTMGDEVVNGGLNIGSVEAGSEATIYFYATVDNSFADDCEESKLTNVVRGKYNNDDNTSKEDTADVTVEAQVCDVPDVPEYPKTGAESKLGAIVATAMLATAAAGYIASRKK